MFNKARLKLTFLYSLVFLLFFWSFSFGVYAWMDRSFGEGYISQVKQMNQQQTGQNQGEFEDQKAAIVTIAGDVALNQLRNILIFLNVISFLLIPFIAWFLTGHALKPIEENHERQKQFVSDASHELKTPLSIIGGEIEVTLRKKRKVPEYLQILSSTKEEVGRLRDLVDNLLFLARNDQGKQAIQTERVEIVDVLSSVISTLKPSIDKKNLHLSFEPSEDNLIIEGQLLGIRQLFLNLLDNAVKYSKKSGSIWVTITKNNPYASISIRDNGIGIATENQEKIFDRFYRVDVSRSSIKGYGLGLSISKSIIEKHKGQLSIKSEFGKGTTFTVNLPLASSD